MLLRRFYYQLLVCLSAFICSVSSVVDAQEIAIVPHNPSAETMVAVSPVIFTGIVTELRYGHHENSKMPFTFVKFAGINYLRKDSEVKTEKGNTIEISLAGGIRDNLRIMEVDELPKFQLGERYLVFLRGGGWRFSPITAFDAGVFRLHGRLRDDAVILNYRGVPLAGVKDGRFLTAPRLGDQESAETRVNESPIPPTEEKRLRELSDKVKDKAVQEKTEEALRERERKEIEQYIVKENDQKMSRLSGYGDVMRLSQMKSFIDLSVKATSGKYEAFSTLYLVPVGFSKEGFKIMSPKE